jgi:hypothetical protein
LGVCSPEILKNALLDVLFAKKQASDAIKHASDDISMLKIHGMPKTEAIERLDTASRQHQEACWKLQIVMRLNDEIMRLEKMV